MDISKNLRKEQYKKSNSSGPRGRKEKSALEEGYDGKDDFILAEKNPPYENGR